MGTAFEMQIVDGFDVSWLGAERDRMSRALGEMGIYSKKDRTNGRKVSESIHVSRRLDGIDATEL
jgi:hypothetical protein